MPAPILTPPKPPSGIKHVLAPIVDVVDRPRWLQTSCSRCEYRTVIHRSELDEWSAPADCKAGK